jgi:hypothetical protein
MEYPRSPPIGRDSVSELRPPRIFRSPSDVDALGRASVLRDGAAFRPASAPHPLLLENHFYQPFIHPCETPSHPHTAPHTPTELEQQLERARSEERNNCDLKESVAEGKAMPFARCPSAQG